MPGSAWFRRSEQTRPITQTAGTGFSFSTGNGRREQVRLELDGRVLVDSGGSAEGVTLIRGDEVAGHAPGGASMHHLQQHPLQL